jgi:hypothetical protein
MNIKQGLLSLMATWALMLSGHLWAETLTGDWVSKWLKSQQAVETFSDQNEAKLSPYDANIQKQTSLDGAFKQGIVALKQSGLYGKFDDLVGDYGFSSPEQWSEIGSKIMSAYMAVEFSQKGPEMKQMMDQMEAMMNNNQIPPEQKEMMKNAMAQSKAMYESSQNVPQSDISAIQPYLPQLRSMGDSQQ